MKGSPEKLAELSVSVPRDFEAVLSDYTQRGFRVLALGYKQLAIKSTDVLTVSREKVEKDLSFLGLIIMQNKLKPSTNKTI